MTQKYGQISIVGSLDKVFDAIDRVAPHNVGVLVQGATGTGKDLVARAIHATSSRSDKPFVYADCGAIPEELTASIFAGHVRGAFTGATVSRDGYFTEANGGTLFLDEITNLSLRQQSSLLGALQTGDYKPVGGSRVLRTDARVISATNSDISKLVQQGKFRADLYHRIAAYNISLPPLRERVSDYDELAAFFIHKYMNELRNITNVVYEHPNGQQLAENSVFVIGDFNPILTRYDWPGNIRELENAFQSAVINWQQDQPFTPNLISLNGYRAEQDGDPLINDGEDAPLPTNIDEAIHILVNSGLGRQNIDNLLIKKAIAIAGTRTKASTLIGVGVRTMALRLNKERQQATANSQR